MAFIQRYPFSQKSIWWKRYKDKENVGDKIIYVASKTIGFRLFNFRSFSKVDLINGKLRGNDETIAYFDITSWKNENESKPISAIKLRDAFYIYNPKTYKLEECNVNEYENIEIINVVLAQMLEYENDIFIRQFQFDCHKEDRKDIKPTQPVDGLLSDYAYLNLKTHNFNGFEIMPKSDDIIEYKGKFWLVLNVWKTFLYAPKEKSVLHLSLRLIEKQDEIFSIKGYDCYVEN